MTYEDVKRIRENPFEACDIKELQKLISAAIDKQIPKRPDYYADGYADGMLAYDYAKCPVCEHEFEEGINDWECDYCQDCGQRLDWSVDVEDDEEGLDND